MPCTFTRIRMKERAAEVARENERQKEEDRQRQEAERKKQAIENKRKALIAALAEIGFNVETKQKVEGDNELIIAVERQ